jgi:hypothetical protein
MKLLTVAAVAKRPWRAVAGRLNVGPQLLPLLNGVRESGDQEGAMKKLLILAAVIEALTGLTLLVYPPILVRLLFDSEIAGVGVLVSRFAGISLIALAVACWPDRNTLRPFFGMLTYNLLVTLYLVYVGISGDVGILLWPVAAVHAGLSVLLVWAWLKESDSTGRMSGTPSTIDESIKKIA